MNNPLVSIVIPISRMAGRLGQLEANLNQTAIFNCEFIIVHDKQDFETSIELKDIFQRSTEKRISLIEGEFGSAGAARNAGKAIATGEWLTFWDSDDDAIISSEAHSLLVEQSETLIDAIVFSADFIAFNRIRRISSKNYMDLAQEAGLWRIFFKRSLLNLLDFSNFKMGEDVEFLLNFKPWYRKIYFSDIVVYKYYFGREFQSTSNRKNILDLFSLEKKLLRESYKYEDCDYLAMVISRIILSQIKNGTFNIRFKCIKLFFLPSRYLSLKLRSYIVRNLFILARKMVIKNV